MSKSNTVNYRLSPTMGPSAPGGRTQPTIKPLATMNARNLKAWEWRLGPIQAVTLLGAVLGSLVCAFYLGAWSGHEAGFSMASERQLLSGPREAISDSVGISDVDMEKPAIFEKLAREGDEIAKKEKAADLPKLAAIVEVGSGATETSPGGNHSVGTKESDLLGELGAPPSSVKSGGKELAKAEMAKNDSSKSLGAIRRDAVEASSRGDGSDLGRSATNKVETAVKKKDEIVTANKVELQKGTQVSKTVPQVKLPAASGSASYSIKEDPKKAATSAKIQVAPKTDSKFVKSTVPKGWYAQVGAPNQLSDAESMAQRIHNSGFSVVIEKAEVQGQHYYRLLVGPEKGREQAERLIGQLKREPAVSGSPFIKMVK